MKKDPHVYLNHIMHSIYALDQTSKKIVQSPYLDRGHEPIGLTTLHWNALLSLVKNPGEFVRVEDIYNVVHLNDTLDPVPNNATKIVNLYFVYVRKQLGQPKKARIPVIQTGQRSYRLLMQRNLDPIS